MSVNPSLLLIGLLQAVLVLLVAPLFSGFARLIRAKMHSRKGPSPWQNYRDIAKLMKRQEVVPAQASWIFRATPYVLMSTMLTIAAIIPIITLQSPWGLAGDLIVVVYLFALARFFFALAGLDSGSNFAGLGASREMTLAVLVEPIMMLVLFVVALLAGSTNLGIISAKIATGQMPAYVAVWIGMLAFAFATFIEMGKLPFDMAEAEQEIQEGPLTEYSGRSLALMKWGLAVKQLLAVSLFVAIFLPFGSAAEITWLSLPVAVVSFLLKVVVFYAVAGIFENGTARLRFVKTSEVTWVAFGVALLSFVFYLANV